MILEAQSTPASSVLKQVLERKTDELQNHLEQRDELLKQLVSPIGNGRRASHLRAKLERADCIVESLRSEISDLRCRLYGDWAPKAMV